MERSDSQRWREASLAEKASTIAGTAVCVLAFLAISWAVL